MTLEEKCCCSGTRKIYLDVFGWLFTFTLWGLLLSIIIINSTEEDRWSKIRTLLIIFLCLYILYLIIEFCSSTSKFLCNIKNKETIKNEIRRLFNTSPRITFFAECYHYETYTYTTTDERGNNIQKTDTRKVITYNTSSQFNYRSVKDVSGEVPLRLDENILEKKYYLKLELRKQIDFEDINSKNDYENQKNNFYQINKVRDEYMDFSESWDLPGIITNNLVKISDKGKFPVNFGLFFIFTLLTFVEFYKLFINSVSIDKIFTIKKIISTRNDLNNQENNINNFENNNVFSNENLSSSRIYSNDERRNINNNNINNNINDDIDNDINNNINNNNIYNNVNNNSEIKIDLPSKKEVKKQNQEIKNEEILDSEIIKYKSKKEDEIIYNDSKNKDKSNNSSINEAPAPIYLKQGREALNSDEIDDKENEIKESEKSNSKRKNNNEVNKELKNEKDNISDITQNDCNFNYIIDVNILNNNDNENQ